MRRLLTILSLAIVAAAVVTVTSRYRADLEEARARVANHDAVTVETRHGPVEVVIQGDGVPLLMIHGTGGGYDQGVLLGTPFLAWGYRVIAPSRFGYLGTPVPEEADAAMQADAFADLLNALGIERAVIAGASAGAISALHFAARHPERTIALLPLVPAYYPAEASAPEPWSPLATWAVTTALRSDFVFWAGIQLAPERMASAILATDRHLIASQDPVEIDRLWHFFTSILPISERADGLILDARLTAAPLPVDLSRIRAPTLVASAEDDRYRTADAARMIAAGIEGARLYITPDGGHVWAGRQDEVTAAITEFLAEVLP